MKKYIKTTLIALYSILFFYIIFPFIYINNFYFWIANNSNEIKKNKVDSNYMFIWNQKMIIDVIKFKIQHSIFKYQNYYDKERGENDYDTFMTVETDADGEPLNKLAERFSIASYHYKAGQLGITRKKGELHEGYEHTKIGSWLANTLRIGIVPENIDLVLDAFQALCTAAFFVRQDLHPKETS